MRRIGRRARSAWTACMLDKHARRNSEGVCGMHHESRAQATCCSARHGHSKKCSSSSIHGTATHGTQVLGWTRRASRFNELCELVLDLHCNITVNVDLTLGESRRRRAYNGIMDKVGSERFCGRATKLIYHYRIDRFIPAYLPYT